LIELFNLGIASSLAGTSATTAGTTDWGSMVGFIMPVLMFGMLGMMMVSAF